MVRVVLLLLLPAVALLAGCGRADRGHDGHGHAGHSHEPRHGGVAVALGDEAYHVEFARGEAPGALLAYFLDGHMEEYVRLAAPSFPATVTCEGRDLAVVFTATTNAATGERPGDAAVFEARIEPAAAGGLLIAVPRLTVKGRDFTDVAARLPATR